MGHKKCKAVELDPAKDAAEEVPAPAPVAAAPAVVEPEKAAAPAASSCAAASCSAEIVGEDMCVLEGSEDEEEELSEIMLAGS